VHTIDPSFHLPVLTEDSPFEPSTLPRPLNFDIDDNLGAFRGLTCAIVVEVVLGFFAMGGWVLWRFLR
jgi:hypothetical protein